MRKIKSFLVINPFGIGDVIFSTPLLKNLKKTYPEADIFFLANRRVYPLIENHPFIKKVFVYERDEFERIKKQSKFMWLKKFFAFIGEIKKERIEVCIDLSLNPQFGFFAYLAGIKKRVGLDYKKRCIFLTDKLEIEGFENEHVADYYLDALKLLKIPAEKTSLEIYPTQESKNWAKYFLESNGLEKELIIGIVPFGGESWRKDAERRWWPKENYALLADLLIKKFRAKIFIFVGPREKEYGKQLFRLIKEKDSCFIFDEIDLKNLVALIDCCDLIIGNDGGPLKIANALGKNFISIFGPVDEKVYGAYPPDLSNAKVIKKDLACRPCYKKFRLSECKNRKKCLKDINVEEVFSSVLNFLNS